MSSQTFNTKCPAVKRLMKEAAEMKDKTEDHSAFPLYENLFEWHFTIRGSPDSDFKDGIYHGRIMFPPEYPLRPPHIMLLTPNGRFEINQKICLSISGHHPETWQPSWSVRTALLALIAFMPTKSNATIGSLSYSSEERKLLAIKSQDWSCPDCGKIADLLGTESTENVPTTNEENVGTVNDTPLQVNTTDSCPKEFKFKYEFPISNSCEVQHRLARHRDKIETARREKEAAAANDSLTDPVFLLYASVMFMIVLGIFYLIYRRLFLL